MFYVVNQETGAVLTYRDGARIAMASLEDAKTKSDYCWVLTGTPHYVAHLAGFNLDALGREIAPWLKRH